MCCCRLLNVAKVVSASLHAHRPVNAPNRPLNCSTFASCTDASDGSHFSNEGCLSVRTQCTGKFCGVSTYLGVTHNVSPLHEFITMPAIYHLGCELPSTRFIFTLNLPSRLTYVILRYDNLNLPANEMRVPQLA